MFCGIKNVFMIIKLAPSPSGKYKKKKVALQHMILRLDFKKSLMSDLNTIGLALKRRK